MTIHKSPVSPSKFSQRSRHLLLALAITLVVFAWFGWSSATSAQEDLDAAGKTVRKGKKNSKRCTNICLDRQDVRMKRFGGNIMDRGDVLEMVKKQKEALIEKLRVDYGEYFEPIFADPASSGDELRFRRFDPITAGGPSLDRLKRKLQMKVLEVQTQIQSQDSDVNGCNCNVDVKEKTSTDSRRLLRDLDANETSDDFEMEEVYARYVWATGGHSASAGHGNLYNESYTAFMERDLKPLFGAIGIEFEGRNYAMGGMGPAPEISMCWNQIFGTDVDFFSWDFGMTEGGDLWRFLHYSYRGGRSPGRPAFIGVQMSGYGHQNRRKAMRQLETMGMAGFMDNGSSYADMISAIPQSSGMSGEEIEKLPEYVRNFVCEGKVENGNPYCGREKYTKYGCSHRDKQASWHPGFKSHALDGNALALFLMQAFMDALRELDDNDDRDPNSLLMELKKQDDKEFEIFLNEKIPDSKYGDRVIDDGTLDEEDFETFWKSPSFCRTGLLPSRSRYLGYMTNTDKVGGFAVLGQEQYDVGLPLEEAKTAEAANGELKLVYEPKTDREPCGNAVLKPDYKDYFYAHSNHSLVELAIPNEKEKVAYGYDQTKIQGLLFIHFATCDWGECPKGDLRVDDFAEGKFEMFVNGKKVTELVKFANDRAMALKGKEGLHWPANENGDYKVGVVVHEMNRYLRLQSIVLY